MRKVPKAQNPYHADDGLDIPMEGPLLPTSVRLGGGGKAAVIERIERRVGAPLLPTGAWYLSTHRKVDLASRNADGAIERAAALRSAAVTLREPRASRELGAKRLLNHREASASSVLGSSPSSAPPSVGPVSSCCFQRRRRATMRACLHISARSAPPIARLWAIIFRL